MRDEQHTDEQYTFEDYLKDFELDYLGFDGIPAEPDPDLSPESLREDLRSLRRDDGSSQENSSKVNM